MNDSKIQSPKQLALITTARKLFWKFGIRRVSIEEICREAGVSKMTFYKYYANKIELVKTIIDEVFNESLAAYREIMLRDISFKEKVEQTIQLKLEQTTDLSNEFYADLYQSADPEVRDHYSAIAQKSIQMVIDDYRVAQDAGHIRANLKIDFIFYFFNKLQEMTNDPALRKLYDSPQDMIMELTNFFFYGILPENSHD